MCAAVLLCPGVSWQSSTTFCPLSQNDPWALASAGGCLYLLLGLSIWPSPVLCTSTSCGSLCQSTSIANRCFRMRVDEKLIYGDSESLGVSLTLWSFRKIVGVGLSTGPCPDSVLGMSSSCGTALQSNQKVSDRDIRKWVVEISEYPRDFSPYRHSSVSKYSRLRERSQRWGLSYRGTPKRCFGWLGVLMG